MSKLFKVLPTLGALALIALTLSLGIWQVGRAREKDALASRYDTLAKAPPIDLGAQILDLPPTLEFHPVTARGMWLPEQAVFADNKVHQGRAGFHVLMPLRLEGSDTHVLVNRGWLPAPGDRSQTPRPHSARDQTSVAAAPMAPRGRGRARVRAIRRSMFCSIRQLRAAAAPATSAIPSVAAARTPGMARLPGASSMPMKAQNTISDTTRGLVRARKSPACCRRLATSGEGECNSMVGPFFIDSWSLSVRFSRCEKLSAVAPDP